MIRKGLIIIAIVFIIIQFVRPSKNLSGDTSKDISTAYPVPDHVNSILERACNDCHSNTTRYPWYAEVQPIGWWLNDHVVDGKRHFNFNTFTSLRVGSQMKKMDECVEQIKKNEMPLDTYLWIHKDAKLSDADKETLITWCHQVVDSLKAKYPPDSLVLKKEQSH